MKKKLFLIVLLLCLGMALFAQDAPPKYTYSTDPDQWRIWGYVLTNAVLRVELNTPVLPFDVDSKQATINKDLTTVRGIFAGTYSFICNTDKVKLTVTHDNLVNKKPIGNGKTEIGYRLDVFDSSGFKTIKTDLTNKIGSSELALKELSGDGKSGPWGIINKAFYVSLWWTDSEDNEPLPPAGLAPGLYESTIRFDVTTEGAT